MTLLGYCGGSAFGVNVTPFMVALFAIAIVWSAIWKGIALWKCGRNKQLAWFIVLLIVNTLGILEIIYIVFFQRRARQLARKKR